MLLFFHKHIFARTWKDELLMAGLGLTGGTVFFLAQNVALGYSTAMNVSLIVCSCPLFTMLLHRIWFRSEPLGKWQIIGTAFSFVGMAAVVLNGQLVLNLSPLGDSLALLACISWAVYSLLLKKANEKYPTTFITRKVFFYGLLTVLPYYAFEPGFPSIETLMQPKILYNLLFLGAIASMLCFWLWTWVMLRLGALQATNYVYVNPVTTIIFAAWILHEEITVYFVVGTALILTGLYLSSRKQPLRFGKSI